VTEDGYQNKNGKEDAEGDSSTDNNASGA
jgi:hypothetical protein